MLSAAIARTALGLSIPTTVLAASGKLDDLIVGWYQIQQVFSTFGG